MDVAQLGIRIRADGGMEAIGILDRLEGATRRAAAGMTLSTQAANRLNPTLLVLAQQATGTNPAIARLTSTLGMLGVGSPLMVGVLGGVAALAYAWKAMGNDAAEAAKRTEDAFQRMAKAGELAERAKRAALQADVDVGRTELGRIRADIGRVQGTRNRIMGEYVGSSVMPDVSGFDAELAQLRKQESEKGAILEAAEREIGRIRLRILREGLGRSAQAEREAANERLQILRDYVQGSIRMAQEETAAWNALKGAETWSRQHDVLYESIPKRDVSGQLRVGGVRFPDHLEPANWKKPPPPPPHTNWAAAAQIGGGMILGTGLAGHGYVAAGLSGGLGMGAQGAALGAAIGAAGGPIGMVGGALIGAVGGIVSGLIGHSKQAREEAKRLEQSQREFDFSVKARLAAAQGDTQYASALRLQAQHEKEVSEATAAGMTKAQIAMLKAAQAAEDLADANARAAAEEGKRKEAIESTRRFQEDLLVRALGATGQTGFLAQASLFVNQRRERADAIRNGVGGVDLDLLDYVQGIERQSQALDDSVRRNTEAINQRADKEIAALRDQQEIAEAALRVQQDQLRAQEQTVSALRSVVEGLNSYSQELKTGSLSALAPYAQLQAAQSQFSMLYGMANGGDLSAASSIRGAGNSLLQLGRGYYGASTSGYASLFGDVQSKVDALLGKFGPQLTVEERALAELQEQGRKLSQQISELQAQQQIIRTEADKQIAAVMEQAKQDRERWAEELTKWAEQNGVLASMLLELKGLKLTETQTKGHIEIDPITGQKRWVEGTTGDDTGSTIATATQATAQYTRAGFIETVDGLSNVRSAIDTMRQEMVLALERAGR